MLWDGPPHHTGKIHGGRYSLVSRLLASGSPMIRSLTGSHLISRPVSIAMFPKWAMVIDR